MPSKYNKPTAFHMNALDKAIMEQCYAHPRSQLSIWMSGYFNGIVLPYQEYFYAAPQKNKLLVAGIRTGKSRLVSMGFLHFAQFNPGARLLNTSISSEQAKIVYHNCLEYCSSPKFKHWIEYVSSSPYPTIRLVNGSELWFRSLGYEAELIRGFEFDLINVDEAAYVTREIAISTLRGRLLGYNPKTGVPRAGIFWMVSSPKGRGWLFEEWKKGDPSYENLCDLTNHLSLRATTFDNPLLDRRLLDETMENMTEALRLQEMYGLFLEDTDVLFPLQLVMNGCDENDKHVRWLYDQIRFFNAKNSSQKKKLYADSTIALPSGHLERISRDIDHYECEPVTGHRYVHAWDLGKKATTQGRNAAVGLVFDITHEPWTMVAYKYDEGMGYIDIKENMERWHEKYSSNGAVCHTIFDATGKGDVVKEYIDREQIMDGDVDGLTFSGQNKPYLLQAGRIAIERGLVRYPFIKKFVDQFSQYIPDDKKIPQDIVMAFCMAMYRAREMTRTSAYEVSSHHREPSSVSASRSIDARRSSRFIQGRRARRGGMQRQQSKQRAS